MYTYIVFPGQECNLKPTKEIETHLVTYYKYYFNGIVDTFQENPNRVAPSPPTVPKDAWRWRCDPPPDNTTVSAPPLRTHKEGTTFDRFYDYQTVNIFKILENSTKNL